MEIGNLHLLSTYLKKWSYQDNRITLSYSFFTERGYGRNMTEMRISAPQSMVNEFLNRVVYKAKELLAKHNESSSEITIRLVNENEAQRKLNVFIGKILKEFNTNKRSRGRIRMISNRSMDFYYNDFEYDPLDDNAKFFVHLNRGVNKMNGDLWSAAIDDLQVALNYNPDNPLANKYMAEALVKNHRKEEALPYFEKYAQTENSVRGLNELAHAYIKLERFKNAEEIFKRMDKLDPNDLLVKVGQAQLAYLQGKAYQTKLDKIKAIDENWLKDYLKKSWEYNLPGYGSEESKMWNAATASRYLGYDRPFDLTKRAFNDEIPCYFDSERGTIRFVKEELDRWVEVQNRYQVDGITYQLHEDRLSEIELKTAKTQRSRKKNKKQPDDSQNVKVSSNN
jgi:tetratricopeptide (TPR) repeat protein